MKMQQEIHALERGTGRSASINDAAKRLTGERATRAAFLDRYGDNHPDVVRSRRVIASLETALRRYEKGSTATPPVKPENPANINKILPLAELHDLAAIAQAHEEPEESGSRTPPWAIPRRWPRYRWSA